MYRISTDRTLLGSGSIAINIKGMNVKVYFSGSGYPFVSGGALPIQLEDMWQNNSTQLTLGTLIDSNTTVNYQPGTQMMLPTHSVFVDFPKQWNTVVRKVRIFDYTDSNDAPTTISLVDRASGNTWQVGSYTGANFNTWDEYPTTSSFITDRLILTNPSASSVHPQFGTELQIIADFYAYTESVSFPPRTQRPMRQKIGSNIYWWNIQQTGDSGSYTTSSVDATKDTRWRDLNMGAARIYMDWEMLESTKSLYEFQPTKIGFGTDAVLAYLKSQSCEPLLCFKTIPNWMANTYPAQSGTDYRIHYIPCQFSSKSIQEQAIAYLEAGKLAFQLAARYGRGDVPTNLLTMRTSTGNVAQAGMNLATYIEPGNEMDADWWGDGTNTPYSWSYTTGRMMGAYLSACYDGHKGTMGSNVGVKNADVTMKLVVPGLGIPIQDYYRGILDWSIQNRGYLADGVTVDLPFDVVNYHKYSAIVNGQGYAPDTGSTNTMDTADSFLLLSNKRLYQKEIWMTEYGWDVNSPASDFRAVSIGTKSVDAVCGDWTIRSILEHSARGVDVDHQFQMYDDNPSGNFRFATTGLVNHDATYTKRTSATYIKQIITLMPGHIFSQRINSIPRVDKWTTGSGHDIYPIWSPTMSGISGTYGFNFTGSNPQIKVWNLISASNSMTSTLVAVTGSTYSASYSETPIFIEVIG